MVTIIVKHLKRAFSRDFHGVSYQSAERAKFIRESLDAYFPVAELEYHYMTKQKAMNLAYRDTNSVDEYWVDALEGAPTMVHQVFPFEDLIGVTGHRSTSVGDIFVIDGVDYFVDSYGFSPVGEDNYEV